MTTNILFVVTSHSCVEGREDVKTGFHFVELAVPFKFFCDNGCNCEVASICGGKPCPEPNSVDLNNNRVKWFHDNRDLMNKLNNTEKLENVDGNNFDGVFFVGGFGAVFDFPECSAVATISRTIYNKGGVIGAVCHGPCAFVNIPDLVGNKTVTAFTNDEEQELGMLSYLPQRAGGKSCEDILKHMGARFQKAERFQCCVQSDNRIVTGQNPASAEAVANEMLQLLKSH
jgi:putative intracellular protease/amidase